ncbi:MAG: PDZ domain-containing protein [Planctomycetes bacterium]|nr:PDZ domain-containing protein [Planctomycetota bacterium]
MRLIAICLSLVLSVSAFAEKPRIKTFDEAWKTTKANFYDKKQVGETWDALKDKYRPLAKEAKTETELIEITNRMLGELKASHLVLMSKDAYQEHMLPELGSEPRPQLGFEAIEIDGGIFVRSLLEGGPAVKAGIKRGDRIVKIEGVAAKKSGRLEDEGCDPGLPWPPLYYVRLEGTDPVEMTVESEKGKPRTVTVTPEAISGVIATQNSVRVIKYHGMKFGYVHTWHFLVSQIFGTVSSAMAKEFSQCDGLLLDVRGRGGSPIVMNAILGLFRTGAWDKPVVLLVDDRSRSAKEIFTWSWMREHLGPAVGRTTEGAVLGSQFFPLGDGSCLLCPVVDGRVYTKGDKLEGKGVTPDHVVDYPLPYANGYDEILEFGKDRLELEVKRVKVRAAIFAVLKLVG